VFNFHFIKVSTENDNNFGYEKITIVVDNKYPFNMFFNFNLIPFNFFELLFTSIYDLIKHKCKFLTSQFYMII
jgi:hypothetical protein